MKKNDLLVIWLALTALFTVPTLSACSDDDNNENQNGGGVTIDGIDQAECFRQNIGLFTETDSLICPFVMSPDNLTPTVFTYYLQEEQTAEEVFLSWIPEQVREAVSRDGSTIVYTPCDAQGTEQGSITYRTALPSETATIAVVEFKGVSRMKGIDKIKFLPSSARPDNGDYIPGRTTKANILAGKWFWGDVDENAIFKYPDPGFNKYYYYFTYPKLIEGKELVKKVKNGCISQLGFNAFYYGVYNHFRFGYGVFWMLMHDSHYMVRNANNGIYSLFKLAYNKNDRLEIAEYIDKVTISETDTTKYWVPQAYLMLIGYNYSIPSY